jgi:hypothetical protein
MAFMVHHVHLSKKRIDKVLSDLNAEKVCRKDADYILKNIYLIRHNPKYLRLKNSFYKDSAVFVRFLEAFLPSQVVSWLG